ncbi:MAG: electron transfer flavoprotein subunit alpha/FixB family protein [Bergeyella sp.]|nr:electron transfer flavoprotein subunit alpha/FixB family protein [Bergeyella sp.]
MPITVYAECTEGVYKKPTLEAVSYARKVANTLGEPLNAVTLNPDENTEVLYNYGINKVFHIKDENLKIFNAQSYAKAIEEYTSDPVIIFPNTINSASVASMLSILKSYALITGAVEEPSTFSPFTVKRHVFSGKGYAVAKTENAGIVLTLSQKVTDVVENKVPGSEEIKMPSTPPHGVEVLYTEKTSGKINLKEAEVVVSGGRGLKGPENWGIIENLAEVLGAATACSKPVSDMGWRPHAEHVGQTGKTIAPKLYIAVGISGAIQHLAGVNSSRTILVINTDPEAPFFKSADYGVVGDALKIVPKLTEKIKILTG